MTGMNAMLGNVKAGNCRLSMNGGIAVKTSTGYKTYDVTTGKLTNCDNFVFDIGDELFFVVPTNKVKKGDIILVGGKPKCVIESDKNQIKVLNYEDSTIDTIVPERHQFMGNVYFYGKIVSMFGNNFNKTKNCKKKSGPQKIMQYMMFSSLFKNKNKGTEGGDITDPNTGLNMSSMLPFMMMGGADNIFGDMFDDEDEEDSDEDENIFDSEEE